MATAKGHSKKGGGKKKKVMHIRVEPAANKGYIVNHRREEPPSNRSRMSMYDPASEPKPAAFTSHPEAMAHVGSLMSQMHDDEAAEGE